MCPDAFACSVICDEREARPESLTDPAKNPAGGFSSEFTWQGLRFCCAETGMKPVSQKLTGEV